MPTCLLIRHGRSSANAAGVLAGWAPGVHLDETGVAQSERLVDRLADAAVVHVALSPLERCHQTAAPLLQATGLTPQIHDDLGECRYGAWTGRALADLAKEPLWRIVQEDPASARFPDSDHYPGESLAEVSERAVAAINEIDAQVGERFGEHAVWAAFSHGDPIKAVLAEALGSGLGRFQRIQVAPASVSVVRFHTAGIQVVSVNDTGADRVAGLPSPPAAEGADDPDTGPDAGVPAGDAVVGGGAG